MPFSPRTNPLNININLIGQTGKSPNTYTTGDIIEGNATITATNETYFDGVEIVFEGISQSHDSRVAAIPNPVEARHDFLQMFHPIDDAQYPSPRSFKPGRKYQFGFAFIVPTRLPNICSHRLDNPHLKHAHTLLPPSLGDPMLTNGGRALLDDMSSELCRIAYRIRVSILASSHVHDNGILKSTAKKVRIMPAIDEEPPLTTPDSGKDHTTQDTKDIRVGLTRKKQGTLSITTSQPSPLQLHPPSEAPNPTTTTATINLRFDPIGNNEQPPKLSAVESKIRVSTFYATTPWPDFPSSSHADSLSRLYYTKVLPLSSLCVTSTRWKRCVGEGFYTASIVVPITLPESKAFVPTFHSCLISRVYALDLCVFCQTPDVTLSSPCLSLRIPVQVTLLSRMLDNPPLYDEAAMCEKERFV
ncbi:hypothetical protein BDV25DRAFT_167712 [Aspergillus avenaceus]|uniref:Arrestin-like N-terminal domain-containing protein n=1 Tax=Aspergillus avenaceus TaxID=36643 RepID=A0A5N6U9G9_ASPAV|nr:hypothetical protein BDV25DRAFT_167712 [Aspergillus avenaceus]